MPRGHYTRSERLRSYFRALMWYGRITMLLKGGEPACPQDFCPALVLPEEADIQTVQALLLTTDLDAGLSALTDHSPYAASCDSMKLCTFSCPAKTP